MPKNILVVDDEHAITDTLKSILTVRGYTATGCYSAEKALNILGAANFDLAIVDIRLPGMNGIDFGKQLSELQPNCQLLLVSGHTTTPLLLAMLPLGWDILQKPFHPTELLAEIESLIGPAHA